MKKLFCLCMALMLTACFGTSRQAQFYTLKPVDSAQALYTGKSLTVGVDMVKVAAYLDKPQIVTQKADSHELLISEMNRWAEPLTSMLQRTIAKDISVYLPKTTVKVKSYGREVFDYLVFVDINTFEGTLGETVALEAWWSIRDKKDNTLFQKKTVLVQEVGDSYESLVTVQSNMVAELSQQIAQKIAGLQKASIAQ